MFGAAARTGGWPRCREITTPETLDRWEAQLESLFAGRPFDDLDVAGRYPRTLPIGYSALSDMIAGQQMDLYRSRYETFEELNLYCYRVAGL